MADSFGSLLKWGLIAAGAYLAYEWWQSSQLAMAASPVPASGAGASSVGTAAVPVGSSAPVGSTATPVTPAPSSTPPATTPAPAFNSLDQTYQRLVATGGSSPLTFSQWNYTLGAVSSLTNLPTYLDVFGTPDPNTPITSAQYWSGMSAWLARNRGMSGLGVYGGLAALAARARGPVN